MADIEMPDADPTSASKAKSVTKASKSGAPADSTGGEKKRFEVKKVGSVKFSHDSLRHADKGTSVECSGSLGMGYRSRQLCYLPKPHYGFMYRMPSEPGFIDE